MKELMRVGQMMSNVLFNLSQQERFTPEERILFEDLRKKWDAAQQGVRTAKKRGDSRKKDTHWVSHNKSM